jgi:hypothetical protein
LVNSAFYKICNAFFYIVDINKPETFEFAINVHKNIMNTSISNASFYMFGVDKKMDHSIKCDFLENFCEKAKITFCRIEVSQFTQKNNTILNFFNNILIRKICKKGDKKKNKTIFQRKVQTENSELSAEASYRMVEEKGEDSEPQSNSYPKLKYRRLSYNQKLSKK